MSGFKLKYLAETLDEHKELERDISTLLDNYTFNVNKSLESSWINVKGWQKYSESPEKFIEIYPEKGKITNVCLIAGLNAVGCVLDFNEKSGEIKINKTNYKIYYVSKQIPK